MAERDEFSARFADSWCGGWFDHGLGGFFSVILHECGQAFRDFLLTSGKHDLLLPQPLAQVIRFARQLFEQFFTQYLPFSRIKHHMHGFQIGADCIVLGGSGNACHRRERCNSDLHDGCGQCDNFWFVFWYAFDISVRGILGIDLACFLLRLEQRGRIEQRFVTTDGIKERLFKSAFALVSASNPVKPISPVSRLAARCLRLIN